MTDIPCRCGRDIADARKVRDGVGGCPCGRRWYRIDFGKHCDQVAAVDNWNRAMRNASSRRKFAMSGRV